MSGRAAKIAVAAAAAGGLCAAAALSWRVQFRTHRVSSAKIPPGSGLRMAFITDVHWDTSFGARRLCPVVERVRALRPDILLCGGDYVSHDPAALEPCARLLARAGGGLGSFAVLGNHDVCAGRARAADALRKAGITPLVNSGARVSRGGASVYIAGVDDLWTGRPDARAAVSGARDGEFTVLLSHNPDYFEIMPRGGIDLTLCGHTHGGQATLFGLWAPFAPTAYGRKYLTGAKRFCGREIIISNGVGYTAVPCRIAARPQVWIIELSGN